MVKPEEVGGLMSPCIAAAFVGALVVAALVGMFHVLAAIEESGLVDEYLEEINQR
jgi:hypothetical protein